MAYDPLQYAAAKANVRGSMIQNIGNAVINSVDSINKIVQMKNANKKVQDAYLKTLYGFITEAQKVNKRIILDVGGDWCIWCHRIDNFIEGNKDLSNLLHNNFVVVKINYSPENKNEQFLSRFPKIPGYPHFFVLNKNGKLIHSQDTGKLEKGKGYDKEKFIAFLKKWMTKKE